MKYQVLRVNKTTLLIKAHSNGSNIGPTLFNIVCSTRWNGCWKIKFSQSNMSIITQQGVQTDPKCCMMLDQHVESVRAFRPYIGYCLLYSCYATYFVIALTLIATIKLINFILEHCIPLYRDLIHPIMTSKNIISIT